MLPQALTWLSCVPRDRTCCTAQSDDSSVLSIYQSPTSTAPLPSAVSLSARQRRDTRPAVASTRSPNVLPVRNKWRELVNEICHKAWTRLASLHFNDRCKDYDQKIKTL